MRVPLALLFLITGTSFALAQATSSPGGGSRGGGSAPGAAAMTPGTGTPTSPSVNSPAVPAPGVANTPVDPGRNNVDVNPPTRALERAPPTGTPNATAPAPQVGQPGATTSRPGGSAGRRPGAAQSANSDGYAECMAMWSPSNSGMSRQDWSTTCNRTRLPPKEDASKP
jgi:hypothetical protein